MRNRPAYNVKPLYSAHASRQAEAAATLKQIRARFPGGWFFAREDHFLVEHEGQMYQVRARHAAIGGHGR